MAAALGLLAWRADFRRSVACRGEVAERLLLEEMMDGMKVVAGARDTEMDLRTEQIKLSGFVRTGEWGVRLQLGPRGWCPPCPAEEGKSGGRERPGVHPGTCGF